MIKREGSFYWVSGEKVRGGVRIQLGYETLWQLVTGEIWRRTWWMRRRPPVGVLHSHIQKVPVYVDEDVKL